MRHRRDGPRPGPLPGRSTPRSATRTRRAGARPRLRRWVALAAAGAGRPPADAGVYAVWLSTRPTARTPGWSTSPLRDRRGARRSRLRPRFGVRALGEQLQERVRFSRDLQCQAGAAQLRLEPLVAAPQLVEPRSVRLVASPWPWAPRPRGHQPRVPCATRRCARCTGPPDAAALPSHPNPPGTRRTLRGSGS